MRDFFKELRRRKVWQAALIYVAVAWILVQVADTVFPMFDAPKWVVTAFTILLALGIPVVIVLAWAYELTPNEPDKSASSDKAEPMAGPEGGHKTTSRTLADQGTGSQADNSAPTRGSKSWIAVMPFKVSAENAELSNFGDGLTDDVCSGLARFSYLAVVARESVGRQTAAIRDVREFSNVLGAQYVIEGGVRSSGDSVRVSVRLIEAASGVSLWAENYTRDLAATDLFSAQDDITDRIVATVADGFGVLIASMTRSIEDLPDQELSPRDWLLRTFEYLRHYLPARHAQLRGQLEDAVERYPRSAELNACLAHLYLNEYNFGFNPRPDPLDRALKAAETAFELDGASQFANQQIAQVYFFRRDLNRFRRAADRAIALNPLDTNTLGIIGLLFVHVGDFERGIEVTQRAMDLNENHAHWCHFSWIWYHCSRGEFTEALDRASMINISGNFWIPLATAAIQVQLGQESQARESVARLLALDPEFASHGRNEIEAWHFASGLGDFLSDGLKQAGLDLN